MLRLPEFQVRAPESVSGVVEALKEPGARILAGGTDILPNLKHRLDRPATLVSLHNVAGLDRIEVDEARGVLTIGARAILTDISEHPEIRARFPSLAQAAGLVASPLLRNMGTIGGNVNLDTRCRYVNQTHFWREAIGGGCLKSEGDVCHVVPGGRSCVAAMSSDCVPALISLGARITLVGANGEREIDLDDYYNTDGVSHINREPGEVTTSLVVPLPSRPQRATYVKWTVRKSIDFPLVSAALRFDLESDDARAPIADARICLGVMASRPKLLRRTEGLIGQPLSSPATVEAICTLVAKQAKPLDNVPYESAYRRKVLPVFVRRALEQLG